MYHDSSKALTTGGLLTKRTTIFHIKPNITKSHNIYGVGNPGFGLGQAHICGGVHQVDFNNISFLQDMHV